MVLTAETQYQMYDYILSGKLTDSKQAISNYSNFLVLEIKRLSKRLYHRAELYKGKSIINVGENGEFNSSKNYKCWSNIVIYKTLHDIKNITKYDNNEIRSQLGNYERCELCNICNIDSIKETGSRDKKRLIRACKLYQQHIDICKNAKDKDNGKYELTRESFLAEESLARFSKDNFANVYSQHQYREKEKYAQTIIPDIIIKNPDKLIVIDCKVYKKIHTFSHGQLKYISNGNRFQVNSYIGRCLQDDYDNKNIPVQGIILHIVNKETMEKYKELNGTDLTIESDRPMRLWLIEDKGGENGLKYIFEEYKRLIENII